MAVVLEYAAKAGTCEGPLTTPEWNSDRNSLYSKTCLLETKGPVYLNPVKLERQTLNAKS